MNPLVIAAEWLKAGLLTIGVTLTALFQPYQDFNRPEMLIQDIPMVQKAELFEQRLEERFLTSEDIFLYEQPMNLGDQCIWNGVHVAYRAIKYGATGSEKDLLQLKRFMKSLELMQTHPSGTTVLLRGRVPVAEFNGHRDPNQRQVHNNGTLLWQEDASGDSFMGQVYAMALAYKYGDEEVRNYISKLAIQLYMHVKLNKFHIRNADGSKTKFGRIRPGVTASPARVVGLLLLMKIISIQEWDLSSIDPEAQSDYKIYVKGRNQIHVAANSMVMGIWIRKYANQNLVKMGIHGLVELEEKERYRYKYMKALRRGWRAMKADGDPLMTYILAHYHRKSVKDKHLDIAKKVLREFSTKHKVEHEVDLIDDTLIDKTKWYRKPGDRAYRAVQPYPMWMRAANDYDWQRDPHKVLGGCNACKEYSGLDFLMAYYTGRLYGFISVGE